MQKLLCVYVSYFISVMSLIYISVKTQLNICVEIYLEFLFVNFLEYVLWCDSAYSTRQSISFISKKKMCFKVSDPFIFPSTVSAWVLFCNFQLYTPLNIEDCVLEYVFCVYILFVFEYKSLWLILRLTFLLAAWCIVRNTIDSR